VGFLSSLRERKDKKTATATESMGEDKPDGTRLGSLTSEIG
jgi:hypothetical protein